MSVKQTGWRGANEAAVIHDDGSSSTRSRRIDENGRRIVAFGAVISLWSRDTWCSLLNKRGVGLLSCLSRRHHPAKTTKKREKLSLFVSELWTAGGDFCLKMAELKTLESIRIEAETKEKGDNGPTREKGLWFSNVKIGNGQVTSAGVQLQRRINFLAAMRALRFLSPENSFPLISSLAIITRVMFCLNPFRNAPRPLSELHAISKGKEVTAPRSGCDTFRNYFGAIPTSMTLIIVSFSFFFCYVDSPHTSTRARVSDSKAKRIWQKSKLTVTVYQWRSSTATFFIALNSFSVLWILSLLKGYFI